MTRDPEGHVILRSAEARFPEAVGVAIVETEPKVRPVEFGFHARGEKIEMDFVCAPHELRTFLTTGLWQASDLGSCEGRRVVANLDIE